MEGIRKMTIEDFTAPATELPGVKVTLDAVVGKRLKDLPLSFLASLGQKKLTPNLGMLEEPLSHGEHDNFF